jgi:hypothetical protein
MTDEQASNWAYKMICCLGISTSNSDINVVGLHKTVKELYEQGRADEREACAKLCEEVGDKAKDNDGYTIGGYACAKAIRARGNHEQD